MRVTFINVGYGDAALFQMPGGYTALLDGGEIWRKISGSPPTESAVWSICGPREFPVWML